MAVEEEDTPKPVAEEPNAKSVEQPIDRYHEEGDDNEEGEIAGGEVDESSAVPESHPLEHSWTLWFDNPSVKSKQTTWGSSLRSVFTFSTVEEFWRRSLISPGFTPYLLALIGEQFDHGDEICGAVVNIRGKQERISIWTKNASNEAAQVSIGRQWKEFLDYTNSIGFIIHVRRELLVNAISKEDAKKLDRNAKSAYTA
ncbi:hypothetical protein Bca4012_079892 [Brassica carinata]